MDKNPLPVKLVAASAQDIPDLLSWFHDQSSLQVWGGPHMQYPISSADLVVQSKVDEIASYKIIDSNNRLLGFGQCYPRLGRGHLSRLVVSPKARGGGLGRFLTQELLVKCKLLPDVQGFSLFVYPNNLNARKLYASLGFYQAPYPEDIDPIMSHIEYWVKDA